MKKINIITLIFCLFTTNVFANDFEGEIQQEYYNAKQGTMVFLWQIKDNQIALKVETDKGFAHFVPLKSQNSLLMYASNKSEDGKYYYSTFSTDQIFTKIKGVNASLGFSSKKVLDLECENVKVSGTSKGTVWYSQNIDVDFYSFYDYFKDNYEMYALNAVKTTGFPLEATVYGEEGKVVSSLKTISIESKIINSNVFEIPKGYENQPIGK